MVIIWLTIVVGINRGILWNKIPLFITLLWARSSTWLSGSLSELNLFFSACANMLCEVGGRRPVGHPGSRYLSVPSSPVIATSVHAISGCHLYLPSFPGSENWSGSSMLWAILQVHVKPVQGSKGSWKTHPKVAIDAAWGRFPAARSLASSPKMHIRCLSSPSRHSMSWWNCQLERVSINFLTAQKCNSFGAFS